MTASENLPLISRVRSRRGYTNSAALSCSVEMLHTLLALLQPSSVHNNQAFGVDCVDMLPRFFQAQPVDSEEREWLLCETNSS